MFNFPWLYNTSVALSHDDLSYFTSGELKACQPETSVPVFGAMFPSSGLNMTLHDYK